VVAQCETFQARREARARDSRGRAPGAQVPVVAVIGRKLRREPGHLPSTFRIRASPASPAAVRRRAISSLAQSRRPTLAPLPGAARGPSAVAALCAFPEAEEVNYFSPDDSLIERVQQRT